MKFKVKNLAGHTRNTHSTVLVLQPKEAWKALSCGDVALLNLSLRHGSSMLTSPQ